MVIFLYSSFVILQTSTFVLPIRNTSSVENEDLAFLYLSMDRWYFSSVCIPDSAWFPSFPEGMIFDKNQCGLWTIITHFLRKISAVLKGNISTREYFSLERVSALKSVIISLVSLVVKVRKIQPTMSLKRQVSLLYSLKLRLSNIITPKYFYNALPWHNDAFFSLSYSSRNGTDKNMP